MFSGQRGDVGEWGGAGSIRKQGLEENQGPGRKGRSWTSRAKDGEAWEEIGMQSASWNRDD